MTIFVKNTFVTCSWICKKFLPIFLPFQEDSNSRWTKILLKNLPSYDTFQKKYMRNFKKSASKNLVSYIFWKYYFLKCNKMVKF